MILILLAFVSLAGISQPTFHDNGVKKTGGGYYCFINATIHVSHDKTIENGVLIIRDGKIEEVGTNLKAPKGCVEVDLKGKHIYPSFIDIYSSYGMPEMKPRQWNPAPQYETTRKGAFNWNECIKPETRAAELFAADNKAATDYRNIGFGTVLTHQQDGLMRGTAVLATLADKKENQTILSTDAAVQYSFRKGNSAQQYPSSLMGCIALLRQTYLDAKWYASQTDKKEENISLQALNKMHSLPQIFDAGDKYNVLRADKIGDEFGIQYIFKTSGKDYQRIPEIKNTNGKLIVPLNFPDPYDVEDAYDALLVSLEDMKHWELAPANPAWLNKNGIIFALTASDLKDKKSFWPNLRKAIKYGLPEAEALKALTIIPAQMIGADKLTGTLEKGKLANFLITSDNIFKETNIIYQNWVQGESYIVNADDVTDVRGDYTLNIQNNIYDLNVKGELKNPSGSMKIDTNTIKVKVTAQMKSISLSFTLKDKNYDGLIRLAGVINYDSGTWDGNGQLPNGNWVKWNAIRKNKFKDDKKDKINTDSLMLGKLQYPNMAFGWDSIPAGIPVLIKNATVWTNEKEGVLKNADVLLRDGKIVEVGKILDVVDNKTWVIDGTGKHVTAGIIDEHSHIAISGGVNEGSHAVTAEVSIADVVNSDDINIYRQLSGGVTAAQLLHGSANCIGGRSATIKLRWGKSPEEMKIAGADGFIKCALGENVKQSNWGENNTVRFPQSRMGVEQVFYDAFYRAKAYEQSWKNYETELKKNKNAVAPRKDIQLDVLVEILNSKRFITCHSYSQSEINMLMHVADSMGFKINTFTHILEGYKVADKMKAHGVSASSFADWWAYKYEVMEAIPYNAAILTSQGVNTGINSDDAEMARRLNQEAAKAVKYGKMSEEDALKMVTLNPAKMLHLDNRMGSIKKGKDADIVIWSDHPLSVYAKAEKTFIDGVCYFDRDRDKIMRDALQEERVRLITKMIKEKQNGAQTQKPGRRERGEYHCDTMIDYEEELE